MHKSTRLVLATVLLICLLLVGCAASTPTSLTPTLTSKPASIPAATTSTTSAATLVATTASPITLNFSYHAPTTSSLAKAILIPWAEDIEKATQGRVKIVQHAGGSLLGSADAFDGVVNGICDIAQIAPEEYPGRLPLTGIGSLPLLFPSVEISGIVMHDLVTQYCVNTELKDVKFLITLPLHPSQYLGNKPVEKMEDLKGLKIRSVGKIGAAWQKALGITPVEIATADVYSALDRGMIDGSFFTWSGALAFGLKDATKYRTECSVYQDIHVLVMNKKTYEKLPSDIQKIFDDYSTPQASRKYAAAHAVLEASGKNSIVGSDKAAGKPAITVLSADEKARWAVAVKATQGEWATANGATAKEMLDAIPDLIKKYTTK